MAQSKLWTKAPTWIVYLVGFLPAAYLIYGVVTNTLGPDPIKVLENNLGERALQFLLIGLAISPLMRFAKINLVKYRRAIGLIAFFYVFMHLLVYTVLDRQLDVSAIIDDIWKRPYITIGMSAFLLLTPLALTSNNYSIRKLGLAAWNKLHKVVYVAVVLGALHYMLLTKTWQVEPIVYFVLAILLVGSRKFYPKRKKPIKAEAQTTVQTA
ncbi:protein-methionine-sulfoxide reductase heme-binding subunit MsrQ [Ahrensia sp. 13_GOM-1096m]|uniref:protein-methionine-sulfoxide reductase heme-binding subunit MsrQ n=1 Tax=Ahrensia sp. 13_GOM-1096m TaxID=1380380 RepID=UPI00047BE124|nr:protein-methionine-sulfoxide reductase heme-binding subunit MsrQ [Ahrensia sp. 13_GOM-1096m]